MGEKNFEPAAVCRSSEEQQTGADGGARTHVRRGPNPSATVSATLSTRSRVRAIRRRIAFGSSTRISRGRRGRSGAAAAAVIAVPGTLGGGTRSLDDCVGGGGVKSFSK